MTRVGEGVDELVSQLAEGGGEAAQREARAATVNARWESAVREVYREKAEFILGHVNAVYVMAADAKVKGAREGSSSSAAPGAQLVVYSDDSLVRSDLDARQEFLKLHLREQGEQVESFRILPSRFDMKDRHPFRDRGEDEAEEARRREWEEWEAAHPPVDDEVREGLLGKADEVEDPSVRAALKRAMNSDLAR